VAIDWKQFLKMKDQNIKTIQEKAKNFLETKGKLKAAGKGKDKGGQGVLEGWIGGFSDGEDSMMSVCGDRENARAG
jgi:hypothetical protein